MSLKYIFYFIIIGVLSFWYFGSSEQKKDHIIIFATCADYPPFEYYSSGELKGFDIELGQLVAQELHKEAQFKDMNFNSIFPALENGLVDAALSTVTVTAERAQNFDFSIPYYVESLAVLSMNEHKIHSKDDLKGKKIACQLGTTMEIWLKEHATETDVITMDSNPSAVEALKAGHVDGVLIDTAQAISFARKNQNLHYATIAQADTGYAIAFKKNSPLRPQVNEAILSLQKRGVIAALQQRYLEATDE